MTYAVTTINLKRVSPAAGGGSPLHSSLGAPTSPAALRAITQFVPIAISEADRQWLVSNCNRNYSAAERLLLELPTKSEKALESFIPQLGKEEQARVQPISQEIYNIGLSRDLQQLEEAYNAIKERIDGFLEDINSRFFKKKIRESDFRSFQQILQRSSTVIQDQLGVFDTMLLTTDSIKSKLQKLLEDLGFSILYVMFILHKFQDREDLASIIVACNSRLASLLVTRGLVDQLGAQVSNEQAFLKGRKECYENLVTVFVPSYINSMYIYLRSLSTNPEGGEAEYNKLVELLKSSKS